MTNTPRPLLHALSAVVLVLLVVGCAGSTTTSSSATHRRGPARVRGSAPVVFTFRHLYSLPAQLRNPAGASLGGSRFILAGGLSAADSSTNEVYVADLRHIVRSGRLPGAQHDAAAAGLSQGVFVFGGANFSQYDHIYHIDPATASAQTAGRLPSLASDVAVTQSGNTAYVIGGYDGSAALNTIVAWTAGRGARVAGHLPVALRYAAVTASASGQIIVIGGTTASGGASRAVYSFDPASGQVRELARLRHPITHAGAVTLGAFAYLVGGRGAGNTQQSSAIWSIDPATGQIRAAGHLPAPTSDAAVLRVGKAIVIAGGMTPAGTTLAEIGQLIPAP